jgi:hypothetical protein
VAGKSVRGNCAHYDRMDVIALANAVDDMVTLLQTVHGVVAN